MTRRESVRVVLFAPGRLVGSDRTIRCAVVNLSACGALLSFTGVVPAEPLRLEFEVGDETLDFPLEVCRTPDGGGLAVAFPRPHSERLHHLIAAEQRRALAQGRVNISERRLPPAFQSTREAANHPEGPPGIRRPRPA